VRRYLLVDAMNTFFRATHVSNKGKKDIEERVAYCVHVTLQSIAAMNRDHKADHVVVCLEGRSWRKDFYKPYKADRDVAKQARTVQEQKDAEAFFAGFEDIVHFLRNDTNATVIQHPCLEADDLIAGWIQAHPDDEHIIVSTDADYHQLLAPNVTQFAGVTRELHTINGIFDYKGNRVIDKKTMLPKTIPDPKFILFEMCMRGGHDNIFSAFPGVRTKGTKKMVGLIEAFADRDNQGYAWNNLMLQRWVDHNKVEHRVLDDYKRNVILVDLTAQPPEVRAMLDECIKTSSVRKSVPMVGARFLKFCGKYNLVKLSEQATIYASILGSPYPEKEAV